MRILTVLFQLFTGKERDSETGFYAFGARYYDCDLSGLFLSVDPMADKYPNISPYAYCAWNPVKLVDPDGRDVWTVSEDGYVKNISGKGGTKKQTVIYANGNTSIFRGAKYHRIMSDLSQSEKNKDGYYFSSSYGNSSMQSAYANVFKSMADNTNVEWRMDRYSDNNYALGTLHNKTYSPNTYEMSKGNHHDKDVVALIHSHPMVNRPNTIEEQISSMGYWDWNEKKRIRTGDAFFKKNNIPNASYYTYFPKTQQLWTVGINRPAFIKHIRLVSDFFFGTYNTR